MIESVRFNSYYTETKSSNEKETVKGREVEKVVKTTIVILDGKFNLRLDQVLGFSEAPNKSDEIKTEKEIYTIVCLGGNQLYTDKEGIAILKTAFKGE